MMSTRGTETQDGAYEPLPKPLSRYGVPLRTAGRPGRWKDIRDQIDL